MQQEFALRWSFRSPTNRVSGRLLFTAHADQDFGQLCILSVKKEQPNPKELIPHPLTANLIYVLQSVTL